jgi:lipopolysaccharide/colanic/teichoic acid biosynthesis glycosyltransferase
MLNKERNRSTRNGLPISIVLFDLKQSVNSLNKLSRKEFNYFSEKLINLISDNTRDFDLKHLYAPEIIVIVLIDTATEGAKSFIKKILSILNQYFDLANNEGYLKIIESISISAHPVNEEFDQDIIWSGQSRILNSNPIKNSFPKSISKMFREIKEINDKRSLLLSPDGCLTISSPILLDIIDPTSWQVIYRVLKRSMDIIGALFGLLFFAPLFLICAVAIKLTSKGPVFFRQKRVGQYGQLFTFLKFRTMYHNCDEKFHQDYVEKLIESGEGLSLNMGSEEKPLFKLNDDDRITKIGKLLRKSSLDELPQFFNVLKGDMSLVGPRPAIPYEVKKYKNWHLRRVMETKPGLTGLWQVTGRNKTNFNTMVRLDLNYIKKQSILLYIVIILKTFKTVLKGTETS